MLRVQPDTSRCPKHTAPATKGRRGAAAVEFALVAPVFILFVFGLIEFGRMMMVQQILTNGAREAARRGALSTSTSTQVQQTIDTYMANNGLKGYSFTYTPATAGNPVEVLISVPYKKVTWMPLGRLGLLDNTTLNAKVVMRKEDT